MAAGRSCFNLWWPGHLHNSGSSRMGKESVVPGTEHTVTNTGPFPLLMWDSKTVTFSTGLCPGHDTLGTLIEEALAQCPSSSPGVQERLYWSGEVSRQDTWFSEPCDTHSSPRVKHPDL